MSGIFPAEERALFWLALRALAGDAGALAPWTLEALSPRGGASSIAAFVVGDGTCGGELAATGALGPSGRPMISQVVGRA